MIYKKAPSRPGVGLPLASNIEECPALHLKFHKEKILLHMTDHATRHFVTVVIPSKRPTQIVNAIIKYWVALNGRVERFLRDNGYKFINDKFMMFCETLNINIHTTGAESPWSNDIVERLNLVLSEMFNKVLVENRCSLDMALAWCINAKNYLQNGHRFSTFQLATGQKPFIAECTN